MSIRLLDYLFGRTRAVGVDIHKDKLSYVCGYWYKGVFYIEHYDTIKYEPGMLVPLPKGYRINDVCDICLLGRDYQK